MALELRLLLSVAAGHAVIIAYVLTDKRLAASRRYLALALLLTIPAVGAILAFASFRLQGRQDSPAFGEPELERVDRSAHKSLLRDRAPLLDRLAGTREERLTALAELGRSGSEDAITTLRWTIEHGQGDAVIEAALTLEKLMEEGMGAVSAAKKGSKKMEAAALAAAGSRIATMVRSRLVDTALATRLAMVARELFEASEIKGKRLEPAVALDWAGLELAVMHPNLGLEILERAVPISKEHEQQWKKLQDDLRFAARCSDEAPSAVV